VYNSTVPTAIGKIIALASLPTLLLAGCKQVPRLTGTYRGFRPYTVVPGTDPVVTKQAARVELIVKGDVTYLSDGGIPAEGHLDYGADSATFVPDSFMGQPVAREPASLVKQYTVELTPLPGGAWLYGGAVKLEKVTSPSG